MKKLIIAAALAAFAAAPALAEDIKIGVTPGPHAQIMEKVKEVAATKGLNIQILEFSDYVVPNQALADGEPTPIPSSTSPISITRSRIASSTSSASRRPSTSRWASIPRR